MTNKITKTKNAIFTTATAVVMAGMIGTTVFFCGCNSNQNASETSAATQAVTQAPTEAETVAPTAAAPIEATPAATVAPVTAAPAQNNANGAVTLEEAVNIALKDAGFTAADVNFTKKATQTIPKKTIQHSIFICFVKIQFKIETKKHNPKDEKYATLAAVFCTSRSSISFPALSLRLFSKISSLVMDYLLFVKLYFNTSFVQVFTHSPHKIHSADLISPFCRSSVTFRLIGQTFSHFLQLIQFSFFDLILSCGRCKNLPTLYPKIIKGAIQQM